MKILVTGATGYIGGRLVRRLVRRGFDVAVLVRDRRRVGSHPWIDHVEIREGDLLKPETLEAAFEGIDVAYYLVHSMYSGPDFAEMDRRAARNVVEAAQHVDQLIYLGGILPPDDDLHSEHLRSRGEVGQILREGLPTTEIRAGPIIGSGSASFEMVRYLTERLPAMIAPKWILNSVQPVGVRDVLLYLIDAIGRPETRGVIDVGIEPLTFRDMMLGYAEVRGLPRLIVPVPVLAPKFAAMWVGLVTPIPNTLAVPLVEGVVQPVVGDTTRARELFPDIEPMSYKEAVQLALHRVDTRDITTRWSTAMGSSPDFELRDREGLIQEVRTRIVDAPPEAVFDAFSSLGGETGWLVWRWAWGLRGLLDQLVGGPGLRRGRRHPTELYPGEGLDFWRVEEVTPPSLLRLRAEMKVPGRAWLQFEAVPEGEGATRLIQTAMFEPRGFFGALYWYGVYPMHAWIFSDLVDAIGERALDMAASSDPESADAAPGRAANGAAAAKGETPSDGADPPPATVSSSDEGFERRSPLGTDGTG